MASDEGCAQIGLAHGFEVFMDLLSLKNPYPAVEKGSGATYGGNQGSSASRAVRRCGCGLVSCLDLLLYISAGHTGWHVRILDQIQDQRPVPPAAYDALLQQLCRRYFPIFPPIGMNALVMAAGLNRIFRAEHIPLRARWSVPKEQFWPSIEAMLAADLPVILAIGPNFPFLWQKNKCGLYCETPENGMRRACATKAHYVNITGMNDEWMRVSSWGRMYYIRREEYADYVQQHSNYLLSNLLLLRSFA